LLLYLVRHGETDWNRTHRIQGSSDIPLNETGRTQARSTGRLLARREWHAVYTSPLSRAAETAQLIANELGLPEPVADEGLVERHYGEAEGLTGWEVEERFPDDTPVPGRESRAAVVERVLPALLDIAERHHGESVVVVSHGGVIRSVLQAVALDHAHGRIRNGSVHSFRHVDGALSLIAFDDPIEMESLAAGDEDLEDQNAVERRESTGSAR
jgi:probable phosphoglycerate mutase